MPERLWSGEGCADNPHFRFVRYSDGGIPLYKKTTKEEVPLDLGNGAVLIAKAKGAGAEKEAVMTRSDVYQAIKALAEVRYPGEPEYAAVTKAMEADPDLYDLYKSAPLRKVRREVAKAGASDAEAAIAKAADALRAAEPGLTKEGAIAKALERDPSLYTDFRSARGA